MAENINRWCGTGNLTKDPELRSTPGGTSVCTLRLACNGRRKNGSTGEWEDKPNYFDVVVWGAHGENCARYLAKGRAVAIDGRLDWHEWETPEGAKRQAVQIVANTVQFLGGKQDGGGDDQSYTRGGEGFSGAASPSSSDIPVESGFSTPSTAPSDDIPF